MAVRLLTLLRAHLPSQKGAIIYIKICHRFLSLLPTFAAPFIQLFRSMERTYTNTFDDFDFLLDSSVFAFFLVCFFERN